MITLERKTCPHDCYDKSFILQFHNYINMQTNSLVLRVALQSTAMETSTMKVINGILNRLKYFCESLLHNYALKNYDFKPKINCLFLTFNGKGVMMLLFFTVYTNES